MVRGGHAGGRGMARKAGGLTCERSESVRVAPSTRSRSRARKRVIRRALLFVHLSHVSHVSVFRFLSFKFLKRVSKRFFCRNGGALEQAARPSSEGDVRREGGVVGDPSSRADGARARRFLEYILLIVGPRTTQTGKKKAGNRNKILPPDLL